MKFYLFLLLLLAVCHGIQQFEETPQYTEVNPGQDAKLVCRVLGKRGQCIWQKDQKVRNYNILFTYYQSEKPDYICMSKL